LNPFGQKLLDIMKWFKLLGISRYMSLTCSSNCTSRWLGLLKHWAKKKLGNNKLLLRAARQLIGIMDIVQEHKSLSSAEISLRRDLKARFLGMTAVEKLRAKQ